MNRRKAVAESLVGQSLKRTLSTAALKRSAARNFKILGLGGSPLGREGNVGRDGIPGGSADMPAGIGNIGHVHISGSGTLVAGTYKATHHEKKHQD